MKKFAVQVIALLTITTGALYFYNPAGGNRNISFLPFAPKQAFVRQLEINGKKIKVEIADTKEKRNKGLGGKDNMGDEEGMLFIFPETKKHTFWMKGLKFPLDFVWIRGNKVVDIILNAPVPKEGQTDEQLPIFMPSTEIDQVLELKAGSVEKFAIKLGDTFTLKDIPK